MAIELLSDLLMHSAARSPEAPALRLGAELLSYAELAQGVDGLAAAFLQLGLRRGDRVAVWLDKGPDCVLACWAAARAGLVFVPVNPVLKPAQVAHVLLDCEAALLVTQTTRWERWTQERPAAPGLAPPRGMRVLLTDAARLAGDEGVDIAWSEARALPARPGHRVLDTDLTAILYTSGSTGRPKGVMLSHRNMVVGAHSVASYLDNSAEDRLLAVLPLSFDAGFSQLSTAFSVGASVVLLTPLLPRDVLVAVARHGITGLTAVPPLYIQLAGLPQSTWAAEAVGSLRYFANTGGRMPRETLQTLRMRMPSARPFLMYGLTEAFRSTYLPPEEVDRRPDSIGKAIPGAEVLVLREDGSECAADEPGELVHRGPLVAQGYWGDAAKTAERFKPLPTGVGGRLSGQVQPEVAVFSGDTVRRDAEGFLYFVGRSDEQIKTSGYRVSPSEVEEALYAGGRVGECAVFGEAHAQLGQRIVALVTPPSGQEAVDEAGVLADCRQRLPAYMVPARLVVWSGSLPRNGNGKIDRALLRQRLEQEVPQ